MKKSNSFKLKTGDLIFTLGLSKTDAFSIFIQNGSWSHVGIILRINEIPWLLEVVKIVNPNYNDFISGKPKAGVRMINFDNFLVKSNERIGIKRISKEMTKEMGLFMYEFYKKHYNKSFETGLTEMFKAGWDGPFGRNKENWKELFCSEFIAGLFKGIHFLDDSKIANEFIPKDFESFEPNKLSKYNGYEYKKVEIVKNKVL